MNENQGNWSLESMKLLGEPGGKEEAASSSSGGEGTYLGWLE